ncbi:uncharacterized protein LOC122247578 isoform X2 [Penaeus japonicus]|uniref:uncharacterized protein LOC122247578 isoform X2 n=1 Tax=Penaeus japonicus TaxID=27405 RepID=UPI001C70D117|nr:uncharacterized protein LOC122247578 isoform X2 [Penaeus japonicus]
MLPHMTWVFVCFLLALTLGSCSAEEEDRVALQTRASGPPARPDADLEEEGKYDHSDHEGSRGQAGGMTETGSETLPQTMALRNPTSLHKRLYPRWYQAYVYKTPSFNRVAGPIGGSKRFQPLHPLARFRGLAMGSSPGYSAGYHIPSDLPLSDQPGHPVPSAPNAQPSLPYEDEVDDDGLDADAEDLESKIRAGDLLRFLKNIASDRGLSSHTKSFRYGISKRK